MGVVGVHLVWVGPRTGVDRHGGGVAGGFGKSLFGHAKRNMPSVDDCAQPDRHRGILPQRFHRFDRIGLAQPHQRLTHEARPVVIGAERRDSRAGAAGKVGTDDDQNVGNISPVISQNSFGRIAGEGAHGRLWRHPWLGARPVPGPRLLLLSPEPVADPPADWMGDAATRFVYDNPAVLWRSAQALLSAGSIVSPDNIRDLVEAAYDEANTPTGLENASFRAEGKEGAARGVAGRNVLKFDPPYDRAAGLWEPDDHTPTRLGEPQVTLRLASYTNSRLAPWCDDPNTFRAWCLSEVSVRASRVAGVVEDPEIAPALAALRTQWSRWDQNTVLVQPVNGTAWHGLVTDRRGAPCGVTYSRATGWTWD
jgi:hypothetical protein